jgi:hypothetical protein
LKDEEREESLIPGGEGAENPDVASEFQVDSQLKQPTLAERGQPEEIEPANFSIVQQNPFNQRKSISQVIATSKGDCAAHSPARTDHEGILQAGQSAQVKVESEVSASNLPSVSGGSAEYLFQYRESQQAGVWSSNSDSAFQLNPGGELLSAAMNEDRPDDRNEMDPAESASEVNGFAYEAGLAAFPGGEVEATAYDPNGASYGGPDLSLGSSETGSSYDESESQSTSPVGLYPGLVPGIPAQVSKHHPSWIGLESLFRFL